MIVIVTVAAVLATLCFIWPAAVAVDETLSAPNWAEAALTPRRLGLLARGLLVAVCSATLAQVLGAALAAGLTVPNRCWRALAAWVCLVVLLTPPYIYAYAWSLLLLPAGSWIGAAGANSFPPWLAHEGRAVWSLATWTAPVAAVILAAGWRAVGRPAFALALPDAHTGRAVLYGALPALRPWIGVALILTGLLAITEHAVSDLCQVQTWNTEVLSLVQSWNARGLLLGWPMFATAAALLLAAFGYRDVIRRLLDDLAGMKANDETDPPRRRTGRIAAPAAAVIAAAILLLPWVILGFELGDWTALTRTWSSFPRDWPHSLRYALVSAAISLFIACGIDLWLAAATSRWRRILAWVVITCAACAAITPPAAVGDSFAAAYLRWPALSNHWLIVSLVTAARYAIIPIIALRVAAAATMDLAHLAAVDGADPVIAWWHVRLPLSLPTMLPCAAVVALLSITEVPASQLVRPAGVESVALSLFNHIHYGRNAEIIALSLYLMAFVALTVAAVQVLALLLCRPRAMR